MNTLRGKLTISYTAVALLIVGSLSLLFNAFADKIFEQYALRQQNKQILEIIDQINQQYQKKTGLYDVDGLAVIGSAALQNGILIRVRTLNNEIHWDIRMHKTRECQVILQHLDENMHSRYPNFQGRYVEDTYDLKFGGQTVGLLTAGYYGPYSLGDNELMLIHTLNRTLIVLGAAFLGFTILLGLVMSRRIASPITSAIATSKKIAGGEYGSTASATPTTRETTDLIHSINEMSQALATKEQQKRQITADVAHELRTPLNNLQGNMEAMIDQVLEPTAARLQNCHAEILRLIQIVEQLQELDLLENRRASLDKRHFDFSELCDSLFADFEVVAGEKGISLINKAPFPALVYADMYRMKQCMTNLLSNAIHHTLEGGTIAMEYEQSKHGIVLRMRDSGEGIPPEDLPHIFERFYRVDKSRSHASGSMGIGLSITRAIVEAHNGTISAESKVGSGSIFSISLPDEKGIIP